MNIISQEFKEMLKKRIKKEINKNFLSSVDNLVESIFEPNSQNKYFDLISKIQETTKNMIKSIIISSIEEIDETFRNSIQRRSRYYINKSNVSRTIVTIFGELTFKRTYYSNKITKNKFFYVDSLLDMPKYDHFDPIVKAIAIDKAIGISQAESSRITSNIIDDVSSFLNTDINTTVSRQTVHNWIKSWNVPEIVPESVETPETLYVMADEKFIGAQDIENDIMIKSFVTFEGVKTVSKGRRQLINRKVFSCYTSSAWPSFMDYIAKVYDFSKIKNIYLLADGGNWIKSGINELKLEKNNNVKFLLCQFHFKQAINRMTTDKELRQTLINTFNNQSKKEFKDYVDEMILNNTDRTDKITKNLNYIMNNYNAIKDMLASRIGSSMESHISHLIASLFSARPKRI